MGSSSGGSQPSGETTSTTTTEVPEWYRPSLESGINRAEALYGQGQPGLQPYSTVAPMAPQTLDALAATEGTARAGIPGMPQAFQQWGNTVAGNFGPGSAGFDQTIDAAVRDITPRVQSVFERAGRGNSGLAQVGMAEEIADKYAGLYNQERQRSMGALQMAPSMEALAYQAPARLAQVGGALEGQYGAELGDAANRHMYNALAPQTTLDQFIARIQGSNPGGGTTTQSQPYHQNRGAGALGGAMSGAGLMQGLGMTSPWGLAAGALGGGLLGMG